MVIAGRKFGTMVIFAGMAPFLAMSFLSLSQSGVWLTWSENVSEIYRQNASWRYDLILVQAAGTLTALTAAGGLLLVLALAFPSRRFGDLAAIAAIIAQVPGILAHTQSLWGRLFTENDVLAREPSIEVVALALATTTVGIYSMVAAAALERIGSTLVEAKAQPDGIQAVLRGNALLLLGAMAIIMAVDALAFVAVTGIPEDLTGPLQRHPAIVTWAGLFGFVLVLGVTYSFAHRRWWAPDDSEPENVFL